MRRLRMVAVATAMAGALLAVAAAPAVAVTCGMLVTADLTLTADLNCVGTGTDGLVVVADGVTVDLDGFTVSGDQTPGLVGVRLVGVTGAVVTDGTVRSFDIGVVVETDTATDTPSDAEVIRVTAVDNVAFGILTTAEPGFTPSRSLVAQSVARDNDGPGIYFDTGTFEAGGNRALDNDGPGIVVHGAVGTLGGDYAEGNEDAGFLVVDAVGADGNVLEGVATITKAKSFRNAGSGFLVDKDGEAGFEKSRAIQNGGFGFECTAATFIADNGKNKAVMNGAGPQAGCGLSL